jgi:Ca-activated chloride channel family protein
MSTLIKNLPRPILFGTFAAIGCLIGALIGETWLYILKPNSSNLPVNNVILLLDTSGSMSGTNIDEVKKAAINLVQRQIKSTPQGDANDSIGVIGFGYNNVTTVSPLTTDLNILPGLISTLETGGGTPMDSGLEAAINSLSKQAGQKNILLFTDGSPDNTNSAIQEGKKANQLGINIIAIATDDANQNLLAEVTGDKQKVFLTSTSDIDKVFKKAEKIIFCDLTQSCVGTSEKTSLLLRISRVGIWTFLLAIGITIALITGQNYYLRQKILTIKQAITGLIVSLAAGLIAGSVGEGLFSIIPNEALGRIVGWGTLGTILGMIIANFIPNLKAFRAAIGGAVGGTLAAISFLIISSLVSDSSARLLGSVILGFLIGITISLVDWATAYLIIHWTSSESSKVSLGEKPIVLGSSEISNIKFQNSPFDIQFSLINNQVEVKNLHTGTLKSLDNGESINFNKIKIECVVVK